MNEKKAKLAEARLREVLEENLSAISNQPTSFMTYADVTKSLREAGVIAELLTNYWYKHDMQAELRRARAIEILGNPKEHP